MEVVIEVSQYVRHAPIAVFPIKPVMKCPVASEEGSYITTFQSLAGTSQRRFHLRQLLPSEPLRCISEYVSFEDLPELGDLFDILKRNPAHK